jgi:hypothetical protein
MEEMNVQAGRASAGTETTIGGMRSRKGTDYTISDSWKGGSTGGT